MNPLNLQKTVDLQYYDVLGIELISLFVLRIGLHFYRFMFHLAEVLYLNEDKQKCDYYITQVDA